MISIERSAKRGLQRGLGTPRCLWTWQERLKLFRLRGPGLGIQFLGLAIDNQTRQPNFCLQTDFMSAFQLIMHSHKDVSLMQFQISACLSYNIAK